MIYSARDYDILGIIKSNAPKPLRVSHLISKTPYGVDGIKESITKMIKHNLIEEAEGTKELSYKLKEAK